MKKVIEKRKSQENKYQHSKLIKYSDDIKLITYINYFPYYPINIIINEFWSQMCV